MHMPSITADCLAVLALAYAALAFQMIRLRRGNQATFSGGVLLSIGLLIACALPLLPWAEFVDEISEQAIAAAHLLEITYVILTL